MNPISSWARLILTLLASPPAAIAALGADTGSVHADRAQMNATLQVIRAGEFTRFELQLPSATTVRQYVSSDGVVFAVSWEGPSLPDLRQLFGRYFQQYLEAIAGGGTGARLIRQPGFVVYTGGRIRAFRGWALVPQLQPRGVVAEELR